MNYQLAESIIGIFRTDDSMGHYEVFSKFNYRDWKRTYKWIDASGLALYLLDRLQVLRIEASIPPFVLRRLQENAFDNQAKTKHLFEEFISINREFRHVGLSYLNLKGFTLAPDAFSDARLRLQLDLDFWVSRSDVSLCQQTLEKQGYWLTGEGSNVKEFKAGGGQVPRLRDLYKSKLQRCVEIHFNDSNGPEELKLQYGRLGRSDLRCWEDLELPVLCDCDRFVALALHLFKHLKGEWTRASWLLEYVNFVKFNELNEALWAEVGECASENEEIRLAVGAATLVSHQNFSMRHVPEVLAWTIQKLPQAVSLWIERYSAQIILAKYPGTKIHLLLRRALALDGIVKHYEAKSLLPLHRPARITVRSPNVSFLANFQKIKDEGLYFIFRLYFHLKQGCYYLVESARWNREVVSLGKADPDSIGHR
jgi:hypothetical protein